MTVLRSYAEDGKYLRQTADELFQKKKNWFIGWKCLAGIESLAIDSLGNIHSAHCKSVGTYGRIGRYGNVFTEFHPEKVSINCARRFCETEFDLSIPKYQKPKYREIFDLESSAVEHIDTPIALRGENQSYKKVHWNLSHFGQNSLAEWKKAVFLLESFLKGEVGQFILQDPPVQSSEFFDFLKFLTDEKGHLVSVEVSLLAGVDFSLKVFEFADLTLRADGPEKEFFDGLNRVSEAYKDLRARRVFRKVKVQVDINNPGYGRLKQILMNDPYSSWLEPGFFVGKYVAPQELPVETKKAEAPAVEKKSSKVKVLFFIPMRNCQHTIAKVISRLDSSILNCVEEILVLDNDSSDRSMEIASESLKAIKEKKIVIRKNEKNYGFGGSHKLAIQYAYQRSMDYVLVVHGDDSGSPQDFLPLLESGKFRDYDLVLSDRLSLSATRKDYPFYRLIGNFILNLLSSIVTCSVVKDFSGGPINLIRVQTFMNKYEHPVKRFDDRISFLQHVLLYVQYRHGRVRFQPVSYREAGGKTLYSSVTQFIRSVLLILSYPISKKKRFS